MSLLLRATSDVITCDGVTPTAIPIGGAGVRWNIVISEMDVAATVRLYQRAANLNGARVYDYGAWVACPPPALTGASGTASMVWETSDEVEYGLLTDVSDTFQLDCSPYSSPGVVVLSGGASAAGPGMVQFMSPTEDADGNFVLSDGTTSTKVPNIP